MKNYLVLIVSFFLSLGVQSAAIPSAFSSIPSLTNPANPIQYFTTLSIKEVQKLTGRKLTLKEKIAFKIFQWNIKKKSKGEKAGDYKDKGKTAMIFGIIAVTSFLLTPLLFFGTLAALAFAIAALATGKKALKANPNDKKAKTAIILGWITIGLLVILAALIAVFLATWSFGWG